MQIIVKSELTFLFSVAIVQFWTGEHSSDLFDNRWQTCWTEHFWVIWEDQGNIPFVKIHRHILHPYT